ncbi:MAG TPA: hypothetical protein VGG13_01930 [Candidatus Saccharimonadales bacterium]|jgi:uncharacterized membrane protein
MNIATYIVFGVGGQCLMTVLTALVVRRGQLRLLLKPRVTGWVSLAGLLRGLGGVCFIFAEVRSNNVGLVAVITNFRLIVILLLAVWLLKERDYVARKLLAALASIAGLAGLFWK